MGPQLASAWQGRAPVMMPAGPWRDLPQRTLLEIGSGMGDGILAAAPRFDLAIGVDVHVRGLAATVRAVAAGGPDNLRIVQGDAVAVLRDQVPEGSLAEVHIWFPDPWPKAKQRKRRLIRPAVGDLLAARLRVGGVLRLATDIVDYAEQMQAVLAGQGLLEPLGAQGIVARPGWRPVTRYERFGTQHGRSPVDLAYVRV